jgi:hypothetical protein
MTNTKSLPDKNTWHLYIFFTPSEIKIEIIFDTYTFLTYVLLKSDRW